MKRRGILLALFALQNSACDDRTPEEKGRDYADEKLGFVEGATDELSARGKKIGTGLGKGVGELVKGTGSAVKDVAHPPVALKLDQGAKEAGLEVAAANEGGDLADAREVVVHLSSKKELQKGARLSAFEAGKLRAHSSVEKVDLTAGGSQVLKFKFDSSVRLSKMESFVLGLESGKSLSADEKVGALKITLSQLSEGMASEPEALHQVSVYARFETAFSQGLSLRAYNEGGEEVGRSEPQPALRQPADSATFLTFEFDARTPLARVVAYKLFLDPSAKPPK